MFSKYIEKGKTQKLWKKSKNRTKIEEKWNWEKVKAVKDGSSGHAGSPDPGHDPGRRKPRTSPIQQVWWSLQLYYVVQLLAFHNQGSAQKCVFLNYHDKVTVNCFWQCPGTSATHLTVSLFLRSSGSNMQNKIKVRWRAPCQLKMPFKGPRPRRVRSEGGQYPPWWGVIVLPCRQINYFFITKGKILLQWPETCQPQFINKWASGHKWWIEAEQKQ